MADTVCGMTRGFFDRRAKKPQEYFVYFKFSKRQNCGKRSDERRRGFVQRFLKPKRQFETILSENKTMECYK